MIKLTVPLHSEMKKGTLHQILKEAGLSLEDFDKLR
jgi:predicted RNA binding protein YcfA (HicA-like mRNA interferase family)